LNSVRSGGREMRSARVNVDRVFELASHLTERDREIVLCLYDHQLLTTDQLELLFAASTPHDATQAPTTAELAAVANELDRVIADAEPQKAKALLRLLIEELRVNGRAEIRPTYRVVTPTVCAMSEKWS
jgi:hypothetical protein